MRAPAVVTFAALALAGCVRDPAPALCPAVDVGGLVITEIRGPQTPEDARGPWVELYTASGATVDLAGTRVRFRRKDGSSEVAILVRRAVELPADGYAVLGLVDDTEAPAHIDYGFAGDYRGSWLGAAAVDVESCGRRIDRATYDVLPKVGTYSYGGARDPDRNDLPAQWCTDPSGSGFGTPQQRNRPCP